MNQTGDAPKSENPGNSQTTAATGIHLSETEKSSRNWSMFCHLAAFLGLGFNIASFTYIFPLAWIGSLIVWLVKGKDYPSVDEHGREASNFQLTMAGLQFISCFIPLIGWFIFLPGLVLFNIIFTLIAAVRASSGEPYRYPLCLRLLN